MKTIFLQKKKKLYTSLFEDLSHIKQPFLFKNENQYWENNRTYCQTQNNNINTNTYTNTKAKNKNKIQKRVNHKTINNNNNTNNTKYKIHSILTM